jgi:nucleoside-triphosphatase THEP1
MSRKAHTDELCGFDCASHQDRDMSRFSHGPPITAILYSEGYEVDLLMRRIARLLGGRGVLLAGFLQRNQPRPGRRRCDMILEELASGESIGISQDRGPLARGCHLDVGELLRGLELGRRALLMQPDLLMINKFGKAEGEGGGFRPLIAEALAREVPVLVAVPRRNMESWRLFASELSIEIPAEQFEGSDQQIIAALALQRILEPYAGSTDPATTTWRSMMAIEALN